MYFFRITPLLQSAIAILIIVTPPAYSACNIVGGVAYGDCANVTVNSSSKGILSVTSYVSESGIIAGAKIHKGGSLNLSGVSNGDISVSDGSQLVVSGVVNGDITVSDGARLVVSGIVDGVVRNNGGSVEVDGVVTSVVANSGTTTISGIVSHVGGSGKVNYRSGAVINGKVQE